MDAPLLDRRTLLRLAAGLPLLGVALPALTGCGRDEEVSVDGIRLLSDSAPRERVALASVDAAATVAGMARFGARLHGATARTDANWTASPLSVALALGMLRGGARRTTAAQVDEVMGFPTSSAAEGAVHPVLNALSAALVTTAPVEKGTSAPSPSKGQALPVVGVANGLFVDAGFSDAVRKEFLALLARQYGAAAQSLEFSDPGAAALLNAWVAEQTRDRIDVLFDEVDPDTRLVLANAVYLKADWQWPFDEEASADGAFTTAAGRSVTARLMKNVTTVRYAAADGWQRVTIPYVGGELQMQVVVPAKVTAQRAGLTDALAAAVAPAGDDGWQRVEITLPRWDAASDVDLGAALKALGMSDAFDPDRADLTGIAERLVVTGAVHRANVTVDEFGTEAAAVTGIGVGTTSAPVDDPVVVRADRPFAWAVVHEPTGTPVFAGHVVDPTARR